jgi:hypothetical protein
MKTVPRARRLWHYRFWTLLPAIAMILFDLGLTIIFQPREYWQGSYGLTTEKSPIGVFLLSIHPAVFLIVMLIYIGIVTLLIFQLPIPWNRIIALALVVGHTAGVYSWIRSRNYWAVIVIFLAIAAVTVFAWQRADLLSRSSVPIFEGRSKNRLLNK